MTERLISLKVVSPVQTVFDGDVDSLVLTAWDGEVGILPGHALFMTLLGGGWLRARRSGGEAESFFLVGGVAKVEGNRVTVLSEYAGEKPPTDFDPARARLDPTTLQSESTGGD